MTAMKAPMRLVLCYKKADRHTHGSTHDGIGSTCRNTAGVLKAAGFDVDIWPVAGGDSLEVMLQEAKSVNVTHVVIAAPFIPADWMARLAQGFPRIQFAVTSHSNVGFLQAEPAAIRLMRRYAETSVTEHNFHAAANNKRLVIAFHEAYGRRIQLLPNLYDLAATPKREGSTTKGSILRIGSFGALRVQKNFTSAVWAAIAIARKMRMKLEFFVNVGRTDNNGDVVEQAIKASTEDLPDVTLIPVQWKDWSGFRRLVSALHLLIQPSYTETFSMVTADAISEAVPVVVTEAMEWCPNDWKADSDDVEDIARVGRRLLHNPFAAEEGYEALDKYNQSGVRDWRVFLHR